MKAILLILILLWSCMTPNKMYKADKKAFKGYNKKTGR